MKLPRPFFRLPLQVDYARLAAEVAALPATAWDKHPTDFTGNSVARLITAGGSENDEVAGAMQPTPHLLACPYAQQVLASFGVVWSRSRLMRLAPGTGVPEHADINYHWYYRVRVHIPVVTRPEVRFHCGGESVHMAAGEVWIFDNWRRHRVENPTPHERIHLVADTTGSSGFWQMVGESLRPGIVPRRIAFDPQRSAPLLLERHNAPAVMAPAELEALVRDLESELAIAADLGGATGAGAPAAALAAGARGEAAESLAQFGLLLAALCQEWRSLWSLHGDDPAARPYAQLRDFVRGKAAVLAAPLAMRGNRVPAMKVLEGRILRALLVPPATTAYASPAPAPVAAPGAAPAAASTEAGSPAPARSPASRSAPRFERPLIIVSAPRAGSTLLFETLACTPQLCTVGGEAHWLIEGEPALRPGAPDVDSNRLEARHYTDALGDSLRARLAERLVDPAGSPWSGGAPLRLLEKTPKNALRVPFFARLFPDAQYLFLWRDPRENLSSILDAWRSGRFVTYPQLPGRSAPWSLLLPPGWQALGDAAPPEQVAALQWEVTNRTLLDDLAALPDGRVHAVGYGAFCDDPAGTVARICRFAGLEFDAALAARTATPLPLSRFTRSAPAPEKWRRDEAAIARVLPSLQDTWDRLRALE